MRKYLHRLKPKDVCPPREPAQRIAWSWLGAFLGIYLVATFGQVIYENAGENLFLIASFGASAVLVYGAPQSEYAQPRNLVGGHILAALIGVSVYKLELYDIALASALAVSSLVLIMHLTRTIHPPGGGTALIAVFGDTAGHPIDYTFVLFPVAISAILLLLIALLVNNMSGSTKQHYPLYWI